MKKSIELLDPFNTQTCPKIVDALLNGEGVFGASSRLAFSPSGNFLVSTVSQGKGRNGAKLCIWDLCTKGLALSHDLEQVDAKSVVALLWDDANTVYIGTGKGTILYFNPSSITLTQEPRLEASGLVSLFVTAQHTLYAIYQDGKIRDSKGRTFDLGSNVHFAAMFMAEAPLFLLASNNPLTVAVFDAENETFQTIDPGCLGNNPLIIGISAVTNNGRMAAISIKSRGLYLVEMFLEEAARMVLRHRFQDAVNRWNWSLSGFSADGEYIWATPMGANQHLVYIWETNTAALVRILEGPKEDISAAIWNTNIPCLLTASIYGPIYRWIPEYPVKWSALVPGLEEVEENVEYIEKEDEFDFTVEEQLQKTSRRDVLDFAQEALSVNVLTGPPIPSTEPVKLVLFYD